MVWIMWAIVPLCALMLYLDLRDGLLNLATLGFIVVAPLLPLVLARFIVPMSARRQYRQSPAMRDEHALSFDEQAVTLSGTRGTVTCPLAELHQWSDLPGLIVLHLTEGNFTAIPKSAMPEAEVAALAAALDAAGVSRL